MLVLILIAVWIAILAPVAIRRLRDRDTDRSIVSFHERMAKLGDRGEPIVEPAHRLEASRPSSTAGTSAVAYVAPESYASPTAPPRLRIVPEGATQADLNRDMSWDEWSSQYLDEPVPSTHQSVAPVNQSVVEVPYHRAAAYSHVPSAPPITSRAPLSTARAQRERRKRVLLSIVGTAIVVSLLAVVVGGLFFEALAFLSWVSLLGYLGLMYYAMSLGMIDSASRSKPVRLMNPRERAQHVSPEPSGTYNEFDYAYEPESSTQFRRDEEDERYARAL